VNIDFNDEIVSIEEIGEGETIDIEVDSIDHVFMANGILTKNSVGIAHTLDLFLALIDPEDESANSMKVIFKQLKNRYSALSYPARKFLVGLDKSKMKFFDTDDWKVNIETDSGRKKTKIHKKDEDVPLFDQSTGGLFDNPMAQWSEKVNPFEGIEV
jgi:hypothetical protein